MGMGVADLPADRYRLVRYDARGHGESGGDDRPGRLRLPRAGRRPARPWPTPWASTASSRAACRWAPARPCTRRPSPLRSGYWLSSSASRRRRGRVAGPAGPPTRTAAGSCAEEGHGGVHRARQWPSRWPRSSPLRRTGHGRDPGPLRELRLDVLAPLLTGVGGSDLPEPEAIASPDDARARAGLEGRPGASRGHRRAPGRAAARRPRWSSRRP